MCNIYKIKSDIYLEIYIKNKISILLNYIKIFLEHPCTNYAKKLPIVFIVSELKTQITLYQLKGGLFCYINKLRF